MVEVNLRDDERFDRLMRYDLDIIQSKSVFSFSLDALLLDNFAYFPSHDHASIVDLCSGNGVLPLTLSKRTKSHVYGVEIQERLSDMAERSVRHNGLEKEITIYNRDLADIYDLFPKDSVDVITCNPPYFPVSETSRKNPNEQLAIARHELTTNLESVIQVTSNLLKMNGRAFFVYRPARLLEMITLFDKYHLTPKKIQFIYPKKDSESNMMLVEAIKHGKERGLKVLHPLFIHDENGDYLPEIKDIIYGTD